MADPRALLDAYAEEIVDIESDFGVFEPIKRADAAGALLTALRAVLDLHPIGNPGVAAVAWCGGCGNVDTAPDWPCANVQAVTAALEAEVKAEQPPPPPPEASRCYWSGGVQVHVKPWCRCGRWPWIPIAWGDESH